MTRPARTGGVPQMDPETRRPKVLEGGELIRGVEGRLLVPGCPIVPFMEGDGIGPDVWRATRFVLDSAIDRAYGHSRDRARTGRAG